MKKKLFMLALGAICIGGFLSSCERSKPCEVPDNPEKRGGSAIITIEEVDAETGVVTRSYNASERHVTWSGEDGDVEISGKKEQPFDKTGKAHFRLTLSARENVIYQGWSVRKDGDRIEDAYKKEEEVVAQTRAGLQNLGVVASFTVVKQNEYGDTHVKFRVEYVKADEDLSKIEQRLPHFNIPSFFTENMDGKSLVDFFNRPLVARDKFRAVKGWSSYGVCKPHPWVKKDKDFPKHVFEDNYYPYNEYRVIFDYHAARAALMELEDELKKEFWKAYAVGDQKTRKTLESSLIIDLVSLYYDFTYKEYMYIPWGDFGSSLGSQWRTLHDLFYGNGGYTHPTTSQGSLPSPESIEQQGEVCRKFYTHEVVPFRTKMEQYFASQYPNFNISGFYRPLGKYGQSTLLWHFKMAHVDTLAKYPIYHPRTDAVFMMNQLMAEYGSPSSDYPDARERKHSYGYKKQIPFSYQNW